MTAIRNKVEAGNMMNYSEWCSINSYKGWLKYADTFRLYQKYVVPLLPYADDYYMGFGGSATPVTPSAPSKPAEKKDLGQVDITYQAYTTKWWSPVTNKADWAGKGDDVPIKWLAIKVSKGSIRCRVYTRKNGWLPYLTFGNSYNLNDKVNGILGDGSEILAVELYYITPDGYKYKMVHYRVSVQNNKNFYADQVDTLKASGMDGFAGDKKRFIDKFQAWIE